MSVEVKKEVTDMCNLSDGIVEQTKNQMIDNMLKDNLSNEIISKYSDKPVDYIESRRKALKSTAAV